MRVNQEESFKPITITLDTREEADAFFGIVAGQSDDAAKRLAIKLSDWFTNNYH